VNNESAWLWQQVKWPSLMFCVSICLKLHNKWWVSSGNNGRMNGWKLETHTHTHIYMYVTLFALLIGIFLFFLLIKKQWIQCLHPRGKEARDWLWPPTPTWCKVKERVKLYLYFCLWALMARFREKFTSQKIRCICISETDKLLSSREVVSSI